MRERRGVAEARLLCSGPGRLTQALALTGAHDGADLSLPPFELVPPAHAPEVERTPRIGISKAVDVEWRYVEVGSEPALAQGSGQDLVAASKRRALAGRAAADEQRERQSGPHGDAGLQALLEDGALGPSPYWILSRSLSFRLRSRAAGRLEPTRFGTRPFCAADTQRRTDPFAERNPPRGVCFTTSPGRVRGFAGT